MIQIRVVCDIHYSKGEAVLEFADLREAEEFVAYLQGQIQIARGTKKQRLEFYDSIYFDSKRLALTTKHEAILRCFTCMDKIPVIDLIYKVWGNGMTPQTTVASTINHLNKRIQDTGIFIERDGDFYTIYRPE